MCRGKTGPSTTIADHFTILTVPEISKASELLLLSSLLIDKRFLSYLCNLRHIVCWLEGSADRAEAGQRGKDTFALARPLDSLRYLPWTATTLHRVQERKETGVQRKIDAWPGTS
jgi:hypothetical protein